MRLPLSLASATSSSPRRQDRRTVPPNQRCRKPRRRPAKSRPPQRPERHHLRLRWASLSCSPHSSQDGHITTTTPPHPPATSHHGGGTAPRRATHHLYTHTPPPNCHRTITHPPWQRTNRFARSTREQRFMLGRSQVSHTRATATTRPKRTTATQQALSYIVRTTYRMPSPPSTYHLPVAEVEQARGSNNRAGRPSDRGGVHRNQD